MAHLVFFVMGTKFLFDVGYTLVAIFNSVSVKYLSVFIC